MKKSVFFAIAMAGMLGSCSQNDIVSDDSGTNGSTSGLVPIRIGMMSQNNSVTTRGTGTVGSDDAGSNLWQGQNLNVYMFNKGTVVPAKFDLDATEIYNNMEFVAPTGASKGVMEAGDKSVKYYPTTGSFDFVGYRLDGAEGENEPKADNDETPTKIDIDFEIDGSQDVMNAKAELTEEERTELYGKGVDTTRVYSAYAARKDVQPNLVFRHLLSRLVFTLEGGNEESCAPVTESESPNTGVFVESIKVESKNKGTFTIAEVVSAGEPAKSTTALGALAFTDEKAMLSLKERAADDTEGNKELVDLTPVQPEWTPGEEPDGAGEAKIVPVGDALLVAPGETEYKVKIVLYQTLKTGVDEDGQDKMEQKNYVFEDVIKLGGDKTFEAGKSYKINIKVYGLNRIVVNAELTPWVDSGENIEIDPMDNPDNTATGGEGSDEDVTA